MAGYTRQSSYADGDIINAADSNNEFNQVLAAFVNTSGHKHDGTAAEGPVIGLIGDPGVATPLNKVVVDDTNNRVGVFVDAGGAGSTVEQLRFQDGAILPVTNNDIDLGSSSFNFKNINSVGTLNTGSINTTGTISPTVNNTNDLGTTSLRFKDIYTAGTVYANNLTVTGTLTAAINPTSINGGTY